MLFTATEMRLLHVSTEKASFTLSLQILETIYTESHPENRVSRQAPHRGAGRAGPQIPSAQREGQRAGGLGASGRCPRPRDGGEITSTGPEAHCPTASTRTERCPDVAPWSSPRSAPGPIPQVLWGTAAVTRGGQYASTWDPGLPRCLHKAWPPRPGTVPCRFGWQGLPGLQGTTEGGGSRARGRDGVLREGAAAALNQGPDEQVVALDTTAAQPCGQRDSWAALRGGRRAGGRIRGQTLQQLLRHGYGRGAGSSRRNRTSGQVCTTHGGAHPGQWPPTPRQAPGDP